MKAQPPARYDVAVVGGGPVGAACAAALAAAGLRLAVVEAQAPRPFDPRGEMDLRVLALSPASRRFLESLHAWQSIAATRCCAYEEMQVWDASGSGRIHFAAAEVGEAALGYIVEQRLLQQALWEALGRSGAVERFCPAEPAALDCTAEGITLRLADGRQIAARLVVAADGAESKTRELAGIGTRGWSYAQRAVVSQLAVERPHRRTAWQRFLPTGPLALLPLADGRVSLVWSLDEAQARAVLALDEAQFCAAVTAASAAVLGRVTGCSGRAAFPLRLQHAEVYTRPRFALLGDAAHTVHPLAGQGVNLGLLDAAVLAEVLRAAHRAGRDLGDHAVLRRYERWRKGENLAMSLVLDGFKRLFGNDIAPLTWLRNAGLRAVDCFTPLKSAFMRRAMGLSGDLPELLRRTGA